MNLGENIYRLRTEKNLSQGDLADALSVSRQSISKWENNSAVPELEKLVRMAQLFEVSLDRLVCGIDPMTEQVSPEKSTAARTPHFKEILGIVLIGLALLLFCLSLIIKDMDIEAGIYFALILATVGISCIWQIRHPSNILIFTLDALFLLVSIISLESTLFLTFPFLAIFAMQCYRSLKE